MESIFSALKLLGPMLLTPIINRVISTFRIRQLYLSFDEVLPCTLSDTAGFVACIYIYNKGKDKEAKVEVSFSNASLCQILASNYTGVSVDSNKLLVDRILPKQIVKLTIYIDSAVPLSSVCKPFIKSEDANGKAYKGRGNVPPSWGPAVMGLSFGTALFITFMYVMLSGSNIFYPYYAIRYSSLMEQGITPLGISDNYLVSRSSFSSPSPITVGEPYVSGSKIVLPLKVKNVSNVKIKFTISHTTNSDDYVKEKEKLDSETPDLMKRVEAWKVLDEKYGFSQQDKLYFSDLTLGPGEEKVILLAHTILPTTTLDNFSFSLNVVKGAYEDETFRDYYEFDIYKYHGRNKVQEYLQALRR